ncbi:hypothetical protein WMY93_032711, partial [Mugilogobius chulae]
HTSDRLCSCCSLLGSALSLGRLLSPVAALLPLLLPLLKLQQLHLQPDSSCVRLTSTDTRARRSTGTQKHTHRHSYEPDRSCTFTQRTNTHGSGTRSSTFTQRTHLSDSHTYTSLTAAARTAEHKPPNVQFVSQQEAEQTSERTNVFL